MKKTLFILCLLSTTAAFAQYSGGMSAMNSQPQVYQVPTHPAHANYTSMAGEQTVLASASYSSAQGERPVSDFPQPEAVSLGAYAREIRKQHAAQLKKARVVWINQ
jgi:hypothetical protein